MTRREEIADIHARLAVLHARLAVLYQVDSGGQDRPPPPPDPHDEPPDVRAEPEPPAAGPGEKPPTNGRQLLGWAGQQIPDAMPEIKNWCAAKRIKTRIVDLTPDQVRSCYDHVRGTQPAGWTGKGARR